MINFGNIQAAAVKSIYKDKEKGKPQEYIVWSEKNGIVPISYQNSVIFFIPTEKCLLKSPETGSKELVTDLFIESLSEIKEEDKLTDLRTIKVFEAKVNTFKTKEGEEIHLRSDYVKMFGKDAEFYSGVGKTKNFVFVREFGKWVGCLGLYKVR
jgi:hypothetical protein